MFIRVRDQNGNAPPKCGHGLQERLFLQFVPASSDGTPKGDRFTDDAGQAAVENFEGTYGSKGCEVRVNEANVNPNYGTARVKVADVEAAPIEIRIDRKLQLPPSAVTNYGSCQEWHDKVFAIFRAHGYNGPGPEYAGGVQAPYLRTTLNEIRQIYSGEHASYVDWQHDSFGGLRPRLFLPHGGYDEYARFVDVGDWGGPLKWERCTDAGKKKHAAEPAREERRTAGGDEGEVEIEDDRRK